MVKRSEHPDEESHRREPLRRLLLVEDDIDTQILVRFALHREGFQVHVCGSAAEALSVVRCARFHPQLLLLDVMLPRLNGMQLLARLRSLSATARTPAVFVTACASARDRRRYRELGALDVVAKPFEPLALAERIRTAWRRHQADVDDQAEVELAALRRAYLSELGSKAAELEKAAGDLTRGRVRRPRLAVLRGLVHRLRGSAALFGVERVASAAARAETLIDELASADDETLGRKSERLARLLAELLAVVETTGRTSGTDAAAC